MSRAPAGTHRRPILFRGSVFLKFTRFAKAMVYFLLTLVLLGISVLFQLRMNNSAGLVKAYFQSNLYFFIAACTLTGTGIYSYRAYTRRHREHVMDSLFLTVVGLVLLLFIVLMFFEFGGLGDEFHDAGHTAANLNAVALLVLPAAFWVRGVCLALSTKDNSRCKRRVAVLAAAGVAVLIVVLVAAGCLMKMTHYEEPSEFSAASGETL